MQVRFGHIVLVLLAALQAAAQHAEFQFRPVTEPDGLNTHFVNFILRDSKGGMWLATNNGLAYYDGAHFSEFLHSRDTNTIINNGINTLAEDQEGNIWGGTQNGIFCYLRAEQRFRNYYMPAPMERNAWNVVCDSDGTVWINGWIGLGRLDTRTQRFDTAVYYQATPQGGEMLEMRRNCMLNDPSGKGLWLATRKGLKYYHKASGQIDDAWSQPGQQLFNHHRITALCQTNAHRFWCFDNDSRELVCFDPATRQVLKRISLAQDFPRGSAITTFESSDGKIWFTSSLNEVAVIDQHLNNRLVKLVSDPADPYSIAGNSFVTAYEDQDGVVWLCTPGGISKTYGARSLFRVHRLGNFVPELKGNNHITQMATDTADGSLWLNTADQQIIRYFPSNGSFRVYDMNHARAPGWDPATGVLNYVRLIDGKVLVCTTLGIYELNPVSGGITPHNPLPAAFSNLKPTDVVSPDNRLFYYIVSGKVLLYNKTTNQATLLPNLSEQTVKFKPGAAYPVVRAGHSMWMLVGNGWLVAYTDKAVDSVNLISDPMNESHGYENWMDMDLQGNLWISFNGVGLYKYDPTARTITRYTQAEGMRDNAVAVAVADAYGNVWSGDRHQYQVLISKTGYFYTFTVPLHQQNASWYLKLVLMKNGHMAAGAFQDVVEFFPDRLLQKPVVQAPVFSGVEVSGKMRMLTGSKTLRLDPDDNSFVIRFGLLTDRELFPYELLWKLDAFEKDWHQGNNRTEAVYNKLPPGEYTFRVKAVAKNQSWASPEETLRIIIAKPFYQTYWFRFLAAVLLAAALYAFYRYRLHQQKQILVLETKAEALEKEKAMIQYESLKQHLNPHFLFNSLTSLRSLIKTDSKTAAWFLDGLSRVYRYVLKSADQELVPLQDEAAFVQTFAEMQQVRFGKGLQVHIRINDESSKKYIAPVVLQNLLENAIKHNTTSPDSPLVIEIFDDGDSLVVRNNLQRYRVVETSNKQGLSSLKNLYSFYSDKPIEILEDDQYFSVRIPLL